MRLSDFLQYDNISIQCHDNPDADSLASGFGVYKYLKSKGKNVSFVYGGRFKIKKANLSLMIKELDIPIEHVTELKNKDLLIMIDCQFDGGNVKKFETKNLAVIDHHQVCTKLPELSVVRPNVGSCSTIIYDLLNKEDYDFKKDNLLQTALYYGLMTDTNNFAEITHPLDRDLRDEAKYDPELINHFKNSNFTFEELTIAGEALTNYTFDEQNKYAIMEAKPCDPNILGIISDILLGVDKVSTCLVYSVLPFGIKMSVRSCTKEVNAGELAEYLAEGIGNAGGHTVKAGGFLQKELINTRNIASFLKGRMDKYFNETKIICASDYLFDIHEEGVEVYAKKRLALGYVPSTFVFEPDTEVTVRTLEGDIDVEVSGDINFIIGNQGEVYPCAIHEFKRKFSSTGEPYTEECEYTPFVKNKMTGEKKELMPLARSCYPIDEFRIFAKPINGRIKVFKSENDEKYYLGKKGDYLACRVDDVREVFVINADTFRMTYEHSLI